VRNDTGIYEGGEISIYYDPMIAKLVTHAADRPSAIAAQARALDEFVIDGIRHNISFLSALMQHERWKTGRLSTGFIAEEFPDGFAPTVPKGETLATLAAIAAHVDNAMNVRKRKISGQLRAPGQLQFELRRVVMLGKARVDVEVDPRADGLDIVFPDARRMRVDSAWAPGQPVWRGVIDGRAVAAQVRPILNGFELAHGGSLIAARVFTEREAQLAALMIARVGADTSRALLCPMPGLVKSIAVREGQEVKAGEALCMVEAMKMENVLLAERDVTVKKILAKEGDSLAVDAVIMEFA
jgi:propionyl-CoA carboxylase alpha chain